MELAAAGCRCWVVGQLIPPKWGSGAAVKGIVGMHNDCIACCCRTCWRKGVGAQVSSCPTDDRNTASSLTLEPTLLQGAVVVIRYEGPKGGPGMPEMLTPTSAIIGAGLGDHCALITDGRFSGGSHGFVIGHVTPEAQEGGPIALVRVAADNRSGCKPRHS